MERGLAKPTQDTFLTDPDPHRAWSRFVEECLPTIDRAALRAAGDKELSQEVAAEVLERLHSDWPAILHRYGAGNRLASFRVWLAVVARNLAIDVLRSRYGREVMPRAVARLPRWQQGLWRLVWVEGRSLADAAQGLREAGLWSEGDGLDGLAAALQEIESLLEASPRGGGRLPGRRPPRVLALVEDGDQAGSEPGGQDRTQDPSAEAIHRGTHDALRAVLGDFRPEDLFLIRAYFLEGGTAKGVAVAAGFGSAAKVYERVKVLMQQLRRGAESRGLAAGDLACLADFDWTGALGGGKGDSQ